MALDLSVLFGAQASAAPLASATTTYDGVARNRDVRRTRFEAQPIIQREIKYFNAKIDQVKTADDLLKDRRLATFVLTGFGLEGEAGNLGKLRKVLEQDPSKPGSVARALNDPRLTALSRELKFYDTAKPFALSPAQKTALVQGFVTDRFEADLGKQNPAVEKASYFERNAGGITDYFQILADSTLREVVTTALGLPKEFVFQDIDKQRDTLEARIDLKDLSDPARRDKLIRRYLVQVDLQASQAGLGAAGAGGGLLSLFA